MAAQDLPLRDIHLPAPVSWWPPAPGWWLLLASAIALTVVIIALVNHYRRKRRSPRRYAQRELAQLRIAHESHGDAHRLAGEVSALLRRVSITYAGRRRVAALTGREWLVFLDGFIEGSPFSQGPGRVLIEAPYRRDTGIDTDELLNLCGQWLDSLPDTPRESTAGMSRHRKTPVRPS